MSGTIMMSREEQLKELESFTDAVDKEIINVIGILGWTVESITNVDKERFTCPYDSSHQLTEESLIDHLASCQWKIEGYRETDIPLSEPTLPVDSPYTIKFDEQSLNEVLRKFKEQNPTMRSGMAERLIPRTSDRLIIDLTSDERKALYDYVIANTAKPNIGQDIGDINNLKPQEQENKELSITELLLLERNLKRRRAKHRGVHTNKKSQVEILKEVINQQMEIYMDYISEQNSSGQITNDKSINVNESNYKTTQNGTEPDIYTSHNSSQNYDNLEDGDDQHYTTKDSLKRKHSRERSHYRSNDRDKPDRYSNEYNETYRRHKHSKHRKSSHSSDRKSHKKSKHRSKRKHKDRHDEKRYKSRDRDKSSERNHSKHRSYREKNYTRHIIE